MLQKISIRDAIAITRDKLSNVSVPFGLTKSIGEPLAECASNLTEILKALERGVNGNADQNGTENRPDEARAGAES